MILYSLQHLRTKHQHNLWKSYKGAFAIHYNRKMFSVIYISVLSSELKDILRLRLKCLLQESCFFHSTEK